MSVTIDHDKSDPMAITGLSMAAHANPVTETTELTKALELLRMRYTRISSSRIGKLAYSFRVVPKVISVLDYTKGFGHSELIAF